MKVICALCGSVGTKADMIHSKSTGNGYCRDEKACGRRAARRKKEHLENSSRIRS